MTNRHVDPLSWVALDCWDVDPADLEVPGQPWAAVIPTDVDNHIDDSIQPLPLQGWREVTIQTEGPSPMQDRLFAAPAGEEWSVAYLSSPMAEGKPILSAGTAVRPRPGKPSLPPWASPDLADPSRGPCQRAPGSEDHLGQRR